MELGERIKRYVESDKGPSLEQSNQWARIVKDLYDAQVSMNPKLGKFRDLRESIDGERYPEFDVDLFKKIDMRSFEGEAELVWKSSGTSSGNESVVELKDSVFYDLAIDTCKRGTQFEEMLSEVETIVMLVPPPEEWPNSSLSYMFTRLARDKKKWYLVHADGQKPGDLTLRHTENLGDLVRPVGIFTTSYMGVQLMESLDPIKLPEGSFIVDTGGYKGVTRDYSRSEFLDLVESKLGIPRERSISEYGMSEMSSHLWSEWRDGVEYYKIPRSLQVYVDTDEEYGEGRVTFFDILNVWSTCALKTSDLGAIGLVDGEEVFYPRGRMPGAVLKGCSITAERAHRSA